MARLWSSGYDLTDSVVKQSPHERWWHRFKKPVRPDYGAVFRMYGVPEGKWVEVNMTMYLTPKEEGAVWFDDIEVVKRTKAFAPSNTGKGKV
jgi:hypothetical protein